MPLELFVARKAKEKTSRVFGLLAGMYSLTLA